MSQLTISISEKGDALIAQLQKEIFQRRRKKVSAEGVIETLIESGAKSQSDKRFAASWQNLVADIERAAKVAQTHGAKPANLSDAEWALVLAHRTRTGVGEASKPRSRAVASRSKTATPKAAAKPRTARSAATKAATTADTSAAAVSSTRSSRAKATPSRAKAVPTTKARGSSRAKPLAAPVPATEVPEVTTAALASTPELASPAPATPAPGPRPGRAAAPADRCQTGVAALPAAARH